ncbi:MAG: hypothetical protein CM1200mP40_32340 [Gammaproteobacteria bacterium]|nr:MAG: hypothetical protein CM1200mP40_32340 [Gammaproteobacteria bacterium]
MLPAIFTAILIRNSSAKVLINLAAVLLDPKWLIRLTKGDNPPLKFAVNINHMPQIIKQPNQNKLQKIKLLVTNQGIMPLLPSLFLLTLTQP